MEYIVKRPHIGDSNRMYNAGENRTINNKKTAHTLIQKGLLHPRYKTKEDKRAYQANNKAYVVSRGAGWYDVYRAGEPLEESIRGKDEANKIKDSYNESTDSR